MSIRSLIEINHDYAPNERAIEALNRYLASGAKEHAEALLPFGIRVLGIRHHSGQFYLDGEPDGFPVKPFPRSTP